MTRPDPPSIRDVVDTHVHFFDRDSQGTEDWWPFLDATQGGLLAGVHAVLGSCFTADEIYGRSELVEHGTFVHVEAAHGAPDPVQETAWLAGLRRHTGAPDAAVVRVGLEGTDYMTILERHLEFEFVKGVRDLGKSALFTDENYVSRVAALGRLGLVFEVFVTHRRFVALERLAWASLETTIVLEHFGLPPRPADDEFSLWSSSLKQVARAPNVMLKLSGLGLVARDWTGPEALAVLHEAFDAFGVERCMFGSNYPIDMISRPYDDALRAVTQALSAGSVSERQHVLANAARQVYRLPSFEHVEVPP